MFYEIDSTTTPFINITERNNSFSKHTADPPYSMKESTTSPPMHTEDYTNNTGTNATSLETECLGIDEPILVPCGRFFFLIYGPLCGMVCLFGLIGNILSFAVLHKYSRNNNATYLLKALAISDSLFLITAIGIQMYPAMAMYFDLYDQLKPIYPKMQTYGWPIAHMVQMGTTYMMVLIAVNRYIAVCKPLHACTLCSKKQVQLQISIICLCIVIYNIPRFFEYNYVAKNNTNSDNHTYMVTENVGLITYTVYNYLYEIASYCVFVFLVPLLILIVLNVLLVRELKRANQSRRTICSRRNAEENNITLVIIVIILVFIVCQSPASVNQILYYTPVGQSIESQMCASYEKYYHISNLLIITNSAINFIVYCLFRRQFRHELLALFGCRTFHPQTTRPFHRTLLLRALHEHSSSFSSSMSRTFASQLHDHNCKTSRQPIRLTDTVPTSHTTTFSSNCEAPLHSVSDINYKSCNGTRNERPECS